MKSALLVLVAFAVTLVVGQATLVEITPPKAFPIGTAGNGTIWYQSDYQQTYEYFTFGNVQNPITVSIIYDINSVNYDASVCLNSAEAVYPIEGVNLLASCPAGGYGTVSNTSSENLDSTIAYRGSSSKSKFLSSRLAMATPADGSTTGTYTTETTTAQIYVKPTTNAGAFIVNIPDSEQLQTFSVFWSGKQCNDSSYYPVGANGNCQLIPPPPTSALTTTLATETWSYFQLQVGTQYPAGVNALNVFLNGTNNGMELYIQRDYYPTQDWFLNTYNIIDDDDGDITAQILNPQPDETYFIGIYNSDSDTQSFTFSITAEPVCPTSNTTTMFGFNCTHSMTNTSSPLGGYLPLVAVLQAGDSSNNGTAQSFDYIDDDDNFSEGDYAYFSLTNYPLNYTTPYFVRVSVANNDPNDENGAPGFFAAKGYFPSAQSNFYNISTLGDVAHQIIVQIDDQDVAYSAGGAIPASETWYFAVALPVDFSIWVGANCAGNCSDGKHGDCYCGNTTCVELTKNGSFVEPLYARTNFLQDSAGACTCSDDDYEKSYDCTERSNGNSVLYIVLIAVGGFIVLAVAIGVPLYCFIANRKENDYDRV